MNLYGVGVDLDVLFLASSLRGQTGTEQLLIVPSKHVLADAGGENGTALISEDVGRKRKGGRKWDKANW